MIFLVLSINLPTCFGADSPQYILNVYAVEPTGASLTPVSPTITPSQNQITIGIAVTTQIPSGLSVTENGFTIYGSGTPNPSLNSVSNPMATIQNANGSVTTKYLLQITVYPNSGVTTVGFSYYVKVVEVTGQPAVTHDSSQLQFTVESASTSTPTASPSASASTSPSASASITPSPTATLTATPTESPIPTPSVPEIPLFIYAIFALTIILITVAAKYKLRQSFFF